MSEGPMNDSNKLDKGAGDSTDPSRVYADTSRDEPPSAMDDAILAKSQSAIVEDNRGQAQSNQVRHSGSRQWRQLFAIAATLVVTASLVLLMEKEQPQLGELAPSANDTAVAPALKPATEAVEARKPASAEIDRPQAGPPISAKADRPDRDRPSERVSRDREFAPDPVRRESAPVSQSIDLAQESRTQESKTPENKSQEQMAAWEQPAQRAAAAPPAPAAQASGSGMAERRSPQSADVAARSQGIAATAKKEESPEVWLARIVELRKQGRVKEAQDNLSEFIKRYPQYKLPSTIIEYQK